MSFDCTRICPHCRSERLKSTVVDTSPVKRFRIYTCDDCKRVTARRAVTEGQETSSEAAIVGRNTASHSWFMREGKLTFICHLCPSVSGDVSYNKATMRWETFCFGCKSCVGHAVFSGGDS